MGFQNMIAKKKTWEAKAQAAAKASKGKHKGRKQRLEKVNNECLFTDENYKLFKKNVLKKKYFTISTLARDFKIKASLAKKAIKELLNKRLIITKINHHRMCFFMPCPNS